MKIIKDKTKNLTSVDLNLKNEVKTPKVYES